MEHGRAIAAVPCLAPDHPDDSISCSVGGNRRRGTRIGKLGTRCGGLGHELSVFEREITQYILAAQKVDVLGPVARCAKNIGCSRNRLQGIDVRDFLVFSQAIAVEKIKSRALPADQQQMRMRSRLIRKKNSAPRTY